MIFVKPAELEILGVGGGGVYWAWEVAQGVEGVFKFTATVEMEAESYTSLHQTLSLIKSWQKLKWPERGPLGNGSSINTPRVQVCVCVCAQVCQHTR